ncbi:unnamed protein product [Alternaria alternata]
MAATNLIIALVFAGVFGAALIYVALWFIHRYIHQSCCEIEHWCHTLFSSQARPPPCVHIGKGEQREPPRHQSRSTKRERERPEGSQTRKYYEHRDEESHAARNANAGWARPMLQFNSSTQPQQQQSYGQLYYPSLEQKQWPSANQVDYPSRIQQQIPVPWQTQGVAHMPPFAMPTAVPQQLFPQMTARMPEPQHPTQYPPQCQPREQPNYRQTYTETMSSDIPKASQPRTPPVKPKSAARRARRVERVDFIHICDEYPPIVLEALKKAAPQSSSSSSSSSSDTSGTTQEVPRVSIPRATPGFADTLPFEFRNIRIRQRELGILLDHILDNGIATRWGLMGRILQSESSVARSRSYERWRQRTTSPRDSGPRKDQPGGEAHAVRRTNTKLNEDTRQGNERERVVTSVRDEFGGRYDRQPEQKPGKERSSTTQEVPRYSPMPIPVVGEPSTPTSVGHTSIPKVPSASGNAAGPRISSAPLSPISQIRNPLKLPRSSVSSLNKGE